MSARLTAPVGTVDAYLSVYIATLPIPACLREAVEYALLGGGKRLRPVLAWHSAVAVGGAGESSLPCGAAVELVHAFSLVHDDLPAMDDDDLRRGRPTLHRHANEAMAILAGDAMLNFAFQLITERVRPVELVAKLVHELALGTTGMIAGQIYDTLGGFESGLTPEEKLRLIHRNKTGALIRASCRMGGMAGLAGSSGQSLGESGPAALTCVDQYADAIGLMFQVVDDILDVTQTAAHTGKRTGKDIDAGKLTYPGVLGLDRSRAEVTRLLEVAMSSLAPLGPAAEPLRELATYMAIRTR